jgi:hypothetical protein
MTICDNCINEVKRITLILIEEYHLNLELDNKYSYLIYRDLGGQEEQPLNMSLECLKKKANLFVVLNSEMLRRLLLVLGTHLIINEHDTVNRFSLCSAAKIISPFNDVINISIKQLQWSLDYEYHYQVEPCKSVKSVSDRPASSIDKSLHEAQLHAHSTLIR